jgi:hypothetical protein
MNAAILRVVPPYSDHELGNLSASKITNDRTAGSLDDVSPCPVLPDMKIPLDKRSSGIKQNILSYRLYAADARSVFGLLMFFTHLILAINGTVGGYRR